MRVQVLAVLAIALAACGEGTMVDVDKTELEGYQDWDRIDAWGAVGGHGDTYRIIYVNREARIDDGGGPELGSILVKEVHDRDGDQPGDLRYTAIMRYMTNDDAPDGAELHTLLLKEYGWLYTYLDGDIDSDEEYRESCWSECHVAAPYNGAFLDHQR